MRAITPLISGCDIFEDMKLSPFHSMHVSRDAHMTPFYDWRLPLSFSPNFSPLEEAREARRGALIFDISHMNRISITGRSAIALVSKITRSNVEMKDFFRYSLILSDHCFIIDDAMIHASHKQVLLVCNASQKQSVHARIQETISQLALQNESIQWKEHTTPSIAIQGKKFALTKGPKAKEILQDLVQNSENIYFGQIAPIPGVGTLARTGYSGEDGFEIAFDGVEQGVSFCEHAIGKYQFLKWAGLGARNILRLEAGLPLSGVDFSSNRRGSLAEFVTPKRAGLSWAVSEMSSVELDDPYKRTGFILDSVIPAKEGAPINELTGHKVGEITSSCPSPTLGKTIAMGYLHVSAKGPFVVPVGASFSAHATKVTLPFIPHSFYRKSPAS